MEHRLTLQHSLNAIDIEIVFVEGQKKKVETNWSNWELRSNQTDWGFMHNLFLHSTYLFIETKHFHIVRNCLKITIEWDIEVKPNWLVHAGSLRHNTSISNINQGQNTNTHSRTKAHTNKYTIAPKYTQLSCSIGYKNFYSHTLTFPSLSPSFTYSCTPLPPTSPPPPQPPQISNFPSLVFRGAHLPESWLPLLSHPNSTFISLHHTSTPKLSAQSLQFAQRILNHEGALPWWGENNQSMVLSYCNGWFNRVLWTMMDPVKEVLP